MYTLEDGSRAVSSSATDNRDKTHTGNNRIGNNFIGIGNAGMLQLYNPVFYSIQGQRYSCLYIETMKQRIPVTVYCFRA